MHWYGVGLYHLCAGDPDPRQRFATSQFAREFEDISCIFQEMCIIPGWNPAGEMGDACRFYWSHFVAFGATTQLELLEEPHFPQQVVPPADPS